MNKIETAKTPVSTDGNVFFEAWATPDGVVQFRDDIYNRDGVS